MAYSQLHLPAHPCPFPATHGTTSYPCSELRNRLEAQLFPDDSNVPEYKRFFPRSRVTALFTRDVIKDVLRCSCYTCQLHQRLAGGGGTSNRAHMIMGQSGRPGAVLLFALLVHIECPSLVRCFLDCRITDRDLESLTRLTIQRILGPQVEPALADRFYWRRHRLAVPQMPGSSYEEYAAGTILPFFNERLIGRTTESGEIVCEGNFGKVFDFELLPEYGEFPEFPGIRRFARKELANTPPKQFEVERENLEHVKELDDPHLVKIIKAYKHGDKYNLVFPLAMTNLRTFLRSLQYDPYSSARSLPLVNHPVWKELLGLARGLRKVHNSISTDSQPMFGYHLDLKPANILVEEGSERLVITDFGQSRFKEAHDATSRIPGRGGTEAYAPPEIDHRDFRPNRRYDIWSLGCIFLEVVIFVIKGNVGVLELDALRVSRDPDTNHTDDRFFRYNPQTRLAEIKPMIKHQIDSLPVLVSDESERMFLEELLQLVLRMLRVKLNSRHTSSREIEGPSRITSGEVEHQLHDILIRHTSSAPSPSLDTRSNSSGADSGTQLLRNLQSELFDVQYWEYILQQVLQGQHVVTSHNLQSACLAVRLKKSLHLPGKRQGTQHFDTMGKAVAVQLWVENTSVDVARVASLAPPLSRHLPRSMQLGPPRRRIVVLYDSCFLVFRMAKNVRIQHKDCDNDQLSNIVVFVPTDKHKDPSFSVSILKADLGHAPPTVPFIMENFESKEEEVKIECSSFNLDFRSAKEAHQFRRSYKKHKKEWLGEWKTEHDRLQGRLGHFS